MSVYDEQCILVYSNWVSDPYSGGGDLLTLRDKSSAKSNKWRIKESTLLLVSVLGGSVTMLCMMRIIRHKTQHHKFMIGIPVIIVLQVVAIGAILFLL